MQPRPRSPYADVFLAAADRVADERPDVDRELARELMLEAATVLHDGLALDGLDEHDTDAAVRGLADALTAPDPTAAVQAGADRVLREPGDLHDPEAVSAAYLVSAAVLRL